MPLEAGVGHTAVELGAEQLDPRRRRVELAALVPGQAAALVLHINREVVHPGAEIALTATSIRTLRGTSP
ncbi:hypothetical protein [Actinomadura sp. GTD37]|uniref:hypothetical protein n=1 Tax=Actinomadura sp. GTD37 TaxID=1778030 RepID=UPI0035BF76F6